MLIGALAGVARGPVDEIAPHPVDMLAGLDPVALPEQAGEAGMGDIDVQSVRIIVRNALPVHRAGTERDPADRPHLLEAMRRDLRFIRRHHRRDARPAALQPDEQEAAPILQLDRDQAESGRIEAGIISRSGTPITAVGAVGPGMIGAGQPLGAAGLAIDQPRAAMAADIGERAYRPVRPANDEDALAEQFERAPIAGGRDVALMADDLPRRADHPRHLHIEIIRIAIDPAGQAEIVQRIGSGRREAGGHAAG